MRSSTPIARNAISENTVKAHLTTGVVPVDLAHRE